MSKIYKDKIKTMFAMSEYDKIGGMSLASDYAKLYREYSDEEKELLKYALLELAETCSTDDLIGYAWLGEALSYLGIFNAKISEVILNRIKEIKATNEVDTSLIEDLIRMSNLMKGNG